MYAKGIAPLSSYDVRVVSELALWKASKESYMLCLQFFSFFWGGLDGSNYMPDVQVSCDAAVSTIKFHPDGLIMGTGNGDGSIRIYDVKSQQIATTFDGHKENGAEVRKALVGFSSPQFFFFCLASFLNPPKTMPTRVQMINSMSFSENGYYMASGSSDGIRVWDLRKLKEVRFLSQTGKKGASCVSFDKVANFFFSGFIK